MRARTSIRSACCLYELLIGAVPFDAATLRNAGLAEMLRIIREDEAPSLSRKLTSMGAAATDIAARRQTDPVSLRRLVDGDLNSITTKALEKSRDAALRVGVRPRSRHRAIRRRPARAGLAAGRAVPKPEVSPPAPAGRSRVPPRALMLLVSSGVAAWAFLRDSTMRPTLTGKDTIVLADFDNKTGDPVFDDTLRQGLSVALQQSPFLSLISDNQIQRQLTLMGQPKEARLTSDMAQQVCERTASAMVLEGSIASLGSQYVLGLRARNCNTGTIVNQEQVQVARREDVLNALSQVARKFRTQVGESLATVEQHSTPLAEATTSSLDALKAYSTGLKVVVSSGTAAGHPFFTSVPSRSIPRFAMAYAESGTGVQQPLESRCCRLESTTTGLATAGSCQRSGKVLHRLHL